ncbi:MAG: flagellar M-ring protein FliF [Burkholderiales bacterium PBB4]|nr:MAG: flagellar M-ring protein FliF [Burkholderiales bacterium PBB4]
MMEANRFGMTQFQERLTFQRGLEGELTRSIQALSSVQNARVHLALPNQNGFFREQQKPSASVLLTLHPGRTLDRSQLAGIVHLVASSVPEMKASSVSVLDDTGKLLSTPPDSSGVAGANDSEQFQFTQQLEQTYSRRILDMLEPMVGKQNVKAQVTAELDFSQTESTTESHKPNQTPDSSAVRSQQTVESTNGASAAPVPGVPGATTNQPPAQSSAPINGAAQPLTAGAAGAGGTGPSKRESTINYEVDKTIKVTKGASCMVNRINAAVVVNNQMSVDDKGKPVSTPLTDAQLEKMTALVRETVGFNKERGDSVNVVNAPFALDKPDTTEIPLWRQPEVLELARSFAWPLGTVLLAALVLLGMVRPALKSMAPPLAEIANADSAEPGGQLDAIEADTPDRPQLAGPGKAVEGAAPSSGELMLEDARKLTRDNPAAVANIVKAWMNGEAPA